MAILVLFLLYNFAIYDKRTYTTFLLYCTIHCFFFVQKTPYLLYNILLLNSTLHSICTVLCNNSELYSPLPLYATVRSFCTVLYLPSVLYCTVQEYTVYTFVRFYILNDLSRSSTELQFSVHCFI